MSQKDYKLIAAALMEAMPSGLEKYKDYFAARSQWKTDVEAVAKALASNNPKFRWDTFCLACGFSQSEYEQRTSSNK
jgi:hypothetical protein